MKRETVGTIAFCAIALFVIAVLVLTWRGLWREIRRWWKPIFGFFAEYENGLTFGGVEGRASQVEWDRKDQTTGCPLAVRLPGGAEIDHFTFESPEAMSAVAGATSSEGYGKFCVALEAADYCVETAYKDGRLLGAAVRVSPRSQDTLRVTVNGRSFMLPVSEEELIQALGAPRTIERPLQR